MRDEVMKRFVFPEELCDVLNEVEGTVIVEKREELLNMALGNQGKDIFDIIYDVPGIGKITEATVARCKNGAAVNYVDA